MKQRPDIATTLFRTTGRPGIVRVSLHVAVASLTSLMEPVMMVFLGGIIGGLIISMYLPIFELAGAVGGTE